MKAVLVISERDNVATALEGLEPGRRLDVNGRLIVVLGAVPPGHKIAIAPIAAGEGVIKYGNPIGEASTAIPAGAHVHTHNVSSSRGRGDLALPEGHPQPRLAEPPDDRVGLDRDARASTPEAG